MKNIDERIDRVCQALWMQPSLSLAKFAQIALLSPSRLQHLFKDDIGMSIRQYAKGIKLENARALLAETERPIKEICADSGIPDVPNFIRYFKERFHTTPAAYRRHMRRGA